MTAPLACGSALLAWAAILVTPAQEAGVDTAAAMRTLGNEFRVLEERLSGVEAAGLDEHASSLQRAAESVRAMRAPEKCDLPDVFASSARALPIQAGAVEAAVRSGDLPRARLELEVLRTNCVACHVRFRGDDARRGSYPARGNTLAGQVSILTRAKEPREERSNVLVFLEGVPAPSDRPLEVVSRSMSQRNQRFEPRVLPILRGTTVDFPNDDFIFHNVFSLSETQPFDLGAYGSGKSKSVLFPRTGVARIYCNIHPEMVATIVVLENPCFALTDRTGFFVITGIPEGTFRVRAWHELGGEHDERLTFAGGAIVRTNFGLEETRATLEHKNKFGKPYRGDYR